MTDKLTDQFTVEPGTRDGDNVADIQGRHGLIPVTKQGAKNLIKQLAEVHGLEIDTTQVKNQR